jgi:hypothetical protein
VNTKGEAARQAVGGPPTEDMVFHGLQAFKDALEKGWTAVEGIWGGSH